MKTQFKKTARYALLLVPGILIGSFFMFGNDSALFQEIADSNDHTETVAFKQTSQTEADHTEHEDSTKHKNHQENTPYPGETFPITPEQQQLIGMQLDTVKNRSLQEHIRTIGRLEHAEPNLTEIVARISGYIEKTYVDETGIHVHKGQKLVTIYSPELVSIQQDYLTALEGNNQRLAERARERLRLLHMPESEIKRMEAKGEPLLEVTLVSPVRGHIMKMNVRNGLKFEPGSTLYRLNNHSKLWLQADIYEEDLPFIKLGRNVEFEIQGRPGEKYEGTVDFIPPMMNNKSRTLPVRIEVLNPDFKLKMGQYGWVTFNKQLGETLSIHRDAVLKTGKRAIVFKKIEEGRFMPAEVQLGPMAGDYYRVLAGVENGDRVVTHGRFWLDAESRLRGIGVSTLPGHQH